MVLGQGWPQRRYEKRWTLNVLTSLNSDVKTVKKKQCFYSHFTNFPPQICVFTISILIMRKLRARDVKWLV
jgi:hypothetical protein